jgi:hypothetical protein
MQRGRRLRARQTSAVLAVAVVVLAVMAVVVVAEGRRQMRSSTGRT